MFELEITETQQTKIEEEKNNSKETRKITIYVHT